MTWAVALTAAPLQGPGSWCLFSLVFDLLILHTFQLSSLNQSNLRLSQLVQICIQLMSGLSESGNYP